MLIRVWTLLTVVSLSAVCGASSTLSLTTPHGKVIQADIYNQGLPHVLVMAPGSGCNPRLDLYQALAAEAQASGYTLVRLYWDYCVADPAHGQPSDSLAQEKEDLLTLIQYVQNDLGYDEKQVNLGGKSLGTFVSSDIFLANKSYRALVMLTPVCSETDKATQVRKNAFVDNYPNLAAETRPVLLAQGHRDPLCDNSHFQEYLKDKSNQFVSLVLMGDHGFGIKNSDGSYNAELGAKNLRVLAQWLFTWL